MIRPDDIRHFERKKNKYIFYSRHWRICAQSERETWCLWQWIDMNATDVSSVKYSVQTNKIRFQPT